MSVIAKMYVQSSGQVPGGALVRLCCVYDNDLSKEENENVRFTKATPSGEATLECKSMLQEGSNWYLIFTKDAPNFDPYGMAVKVRCHVIHDYGTSKQVEVSTAYDQEGIPETGKLSNAKSPPFHLKMTIDNPAASIQFEPGEVYYVQMLGAGNMSMTDAIAKARAA